MRKIQVLSAALVIGALAPIANATVFFNDDFSTFTNGDLVGQNGWAQRGTTATLPLQVNGGRVVIGGGQTVDNQDAIKVAGAPTIADGTSLFMGARFTINSASTATGGSSYFLALRTGGFDNLRIAVRESSAGKFQLGLRFNGQAANVFAWGSELDYGVRYNLIAAFNSIAGATNDTASVFINPTSQQIGNNTAYASVTSLATDLVGPVDGVVISQFGNATGVVSADLALARVLLADNFQEAFDAVPEPATMSILALGALAALRRRNRK